MKPTGDTPSGVREGTGPPDAAGERYPPFGFCSFFSSCLLRALRASVVKSEVRNLTRGLHRWLIPACSTVARSCTAWGRASGSVALSSLLAQEQARGAGTKAAPGRCAEAGAFPGEGEVVHLPDHGGGAEPYRHVRPQAEARASSI